MYNRYIRDDDGVYARQPQPEPEPIPWESACHRRMGDMVQQLSERFQGL